MEDFHPLIITMIHEATEHMRGMTNAMRLTTFDNLLTELNHTRRTCKEDNRYYGHGGRELDRLIERVEFARDMEIRSVFHNNVFNPN